MSIIVQTGNFTKNDLLGKYFAKILTRRTDRLFRRTLLDDYSENIKIYNSLLYLSICFFIIFIDIEEIKSRNSSSLIIKEKNDKKEVGVIDYSKPLKQ